VLIEFGVDFREFWKVGKFLANNFVMGSEYFESPYLQKGLKIEKKEGEKNYLSKKMQKNELYNFMS
jgi:hypothetical protein